MKITQILCSAVMLCTFSMLQTSEGMDLKGDTTCTLCKWVVEEIEKALNFGHNEEIILETLIDVSYTRNKNIIFFLQCDLL